MKIAQRTKKIDPFYVMEVAKAASEIESQQNLTDPAMIHLTIGEPDFTAPAHVQEAAIKAIRQGVTQYTPALGIMPLREKISEWYLDRFSLNVPPQRIIITAGASAALLLACHLDTPARIATSLAVTFCRFADLIVIQGPVVE
ncbi:TPA: aminotransferase class I/II-fold pyridoxal phosphate-dependent enzyme [Klebsiella pneumoniae]|uniref:aminotransferase class I/II-fold pyridoxal phosphate-dependent enzyme n=1 Tax=Klebsiella pneumoniae complex TaxID=3390273 RepID=UPI000A2720CF|nr:MULTISPECIES: aminotransferase class I/II-fold pyridoxal phosphate-dependent enzyme [Klebsiella]EIX9755197.1 aminotransferase class I/II-fold pyridoxal phosphate-dependent enzyme [Klebsiella pneumoniae]MBC9925404.1 aminotransferase class I/II-fold pyridoxal phosphate-dependent enzyme [Klebsiella quasipneumoniae]MBC9942333.1 aminotransferase class I/II-fold pyridoxal phosphate-dependent enzyme [Klebsiella quasipneumoniae]MBC9952478.1 aminotransferase class I/II-fold pyridoxal phosphate-depend